VSVDSFKELLLARLLSALLLLAGLNGANVERVFSSTYDKAIVRCALAYGRLLYAVVSQTVLWAVRDGFQRSLQPKVVLPACGLLL
jgi:hypothetical protein